MWESVIRLETYVDMCGNGLWGQCYARMERWLCEKVMFRDQQYLEIRI